MSENQELEMNRQEVDPMAVLPLEEKGKGEKRESNSKNFPSIEESLDTHSYSLGEVPQPQLVDPAAFLPLNSDRLIGSINIVEKTLFEVGMLIEEEVNSIQRFQKRITFWEDRIEKNRTAIKKNELEIKQNTIDALYDKKNRDYWYNRAEEVEIDYAHAEVAGRPQDWAWLIKKYGLKNADGTEVDAKGNCVEELCNGEIKNLAGEYRNTGHKYENSRKDKEAENNRLVRENAKLFHSNETLQNYITATYTNEIEPLQDGVLLYKELGVKLKALGQNQQATYAELRGWAEPFLNDFIKANSRVPQGVVTQFRKLTSIPLPPEYC